MPGAHKGVKALIQCFNAGDIPPVRAPGCYCMLHASTDIGWTQLLASSTSEDVLIWSSCLKSFFSELPSPLLTNALYPEYIAAMQQGRDRASQTAALCAVLRKLPPPFRTTAAYLIRHLRNVGAVLG